MADKKNGYLMFRGKPLIRNGNFIYYGNASDEFAVVMQIMSSEEVNGFRLAKTVNVQLYCTDPEVKATERIVKRTDKVGLYNAMDIADIWLERALSQA